MDFSEDFAAVQGILTSLHNELGDFTAIKKDEGNETKLSRIIEGLRSYFSSKTYLLNNKVNPKYESELRKIHFFLVLNTRLENELTFFKESRFAHLLNIIPSLSKWLLINLVWKLNLLQFHAEAIYSLPVEISYELLDYCNDCIKVDEPYAVLEKSALFATAIYVKTYHLRNDVIAKHKIGEYVTVLLQKFIQILNNYITPETNQMQLWPPTEIYQYMGMAILEILKLLKCTFNIFLHNLVSPLNPLYTLKYDQEIEKNKHLSKSIQAMKNYNNCLMSTCEANLEAVTLEVFCSWAEFQFNNAQMQRAIGHLADELSKELHHFEDSGKLPLMLKGIAIKPQSIEEIVNEADEPTLLENVVIQNENQSCWLKGLLKHGILNSDQVFETFRSVIHLCDAEHFMYLFNFYSNDAKNHPDLRDLFMDNMNKSLDSFSIINIAKTYFSKNEFNNIYELPDFDTKMQEYFNKLIENTEKSLLRKEAAILVVQNPNKFITALFDESMKNVDHLSNILDILNFIKPICLLYNQDEDKSFLFELILKNLKERDYNATSENCIIQLIKNLVDFQILPQQILEKLLLIFESCIDLNRYDKAKLITKICYSLPSSVLENYDCIDIVLRLVTALGKVRWNFFTYFEEKMHLIVEILALIEVYKKYISEVSLREDTLDKSLEAMENKIDCYHAAFKHTPPKDNFLSWSSANYNKNDNRNKQVCRLIKLLPTCIPEEWKLIITYLLTDKDPVEILQLLTDTFLVLAELAKKSTDAQLCLLFCFQQYCIAINDLIYPLIRNDNEKEKTFIKNMCKLIKRLPIELQKSAEVSVMNLFDFEIMKSMKNDEEFICNLLAISHLEICKIICIKIS